MEILQIKPSPDISHDAYGCRGLSFAIHVKIASISSALVADNDPHTRRRRRRLSNSVRVIVFGFFTAGRRRTSGCCSSVRCSALGIRAREVQRKFRHAVLFVLGQLAHPRNIEDAPTGNSRVQGSRLKRSGVSGHRRSMRAAASQVDPVADISEVFALNGKTIDSRRNALGLGTTRVRRG
jgi:hypothetical protein